MPTKFKLNDTVKLNPDEAEELENDIKYSAVDFTALYKIIKIDDFHGINHYQLQHLKTKEIFYIHKYIPYGFIDAEILLVQKIVTHTKKSITTYLEKLVLHRFSKKQLHQKMKNDFLLQDLIIFKNYCDTLEENDDSFIFTLQVQDLQVDVTLFYIFTNKKDTFLVTEVAYDFQQDLKPCIYCDDNNLGNHYLCELCGAGMCNVCFSTLTELDIHYVKILENCDSEREVKLITEACKGEPEFLCEICVEIILK